MFTLFPNATSPASTFMSQHGAMILIAAMSLATIAIAILFGKPGNGGGDGDFGSASHCHDGGSDGGDCSAD